MKYILLLITFLVAQSGIACDKNVQLLGQGEIAPCDGYLFSKAAEKNIRLLEERAKSFAAYEEQLRAKNKTLKEKYRTVLKIAELEKQKSEVWRIAAEKSTTALMKTQINSGYKDWLVFTGGILTTVAAGYAIGQAGK